jgi:hypothetical protein
MKNFDSRTYSVNDFRDWHDRNELALQPKFQRRSVWSDKARSYLMDSILRSKPIPKIFIRQDINPKTKKTLSDIPAGWKDFARSSMASKGFARFLHSWRMASK